MRLELPALLAAAVLMTLSGNVRAATVADPNIFNEGASPATVAASSLYGGYSIASVDDLNGNNQFFFADGGPENLLSLSNFGGAKIDVLRFYDPQEYQLSRVVHSVTIYTSTTNYATSSNAASLVSANYTLLGTFTLSVGTDGFYTTGADPGGNSNYGKYDDLTNIGVPIGTESLLFDFGHAGDIGTGFSEIQAFTAVPEPSTYAMALAGLVVLAVGLGRRQRA